MTSPQQRPGPVAVIGAGTMGTGIAIAFAAAGSADVRLMSRNPATLAKAAARISRAADPAAAPGGAGAAGRAGAAAPAGAAGGSAICLTTSLADAAAGAALIIESIPEDAAAKAELLATAEALAPSTAIITSNTSSVPAGELAAALARRGRFAGYHWFNPAELIGLVEIVSGPETAAETVAQLSRWTRWAGKIPVHVRRAVPGMISNRLQYALLREAYALVADGVCSYADVDDVVRLALGARWAAVGPFETMDLAGLDVHAAVAGRLFPVLSAATEVPQAVRQLTAAGDLGCKTGRGLRGSYSPEDVTGIEQRRDGVLRMLAAARDAGQQ